MRCSNRRSETDHLTLLFAAAIVAAIALGACSGGGTGARDSGAEVGQPDAPAGEPGADGAKDAADPGETPADSGEAAPADAGIPPAPDCTLPAPTTGKIYYVAAKQPAASNETCDGLAGKDEGGGRCPFKDFSSLRVRKILFEGPGGEFGTRGVTLLVRDGRYPIVPLVAFPSEPPIPVYVNATKTTAKDGVTLAAYPGEKPILDGTCPSTFKDCASPEDPGRIWTLLQIFGKNVRVHGLTFENVHKWNILIGASDTVIACNRFVGPHGSDSDSIKNAIQEGPVLVAGNTFLGPYEQAIDATTARGWLVEHNEFRDGGKGVGFKFGADGNEVRYNDFHDLAGQAIDLGGASSKHAADYEATDIRAHHNRIHDLGGAAVNIFYCKDCEFSHNDVWKTAIGIYFGNGDWTTLCRDGAGCLPSKGSRFAGNRFRDLTGNSDAPANLFVAADPRTSADLTGTDNLYCVPDGQPEKFWRGGLSFLDLAGWRANTGTDITSTVASGSAPACSAW